MAIELPGNNRLDRAIRRAVAVTPNDSADLAVMTKAFIVGAAGDIKVDMAEGEDALVIYAIAGFQYNLQITRVYSTGTDATGIVALY